MDRTPNAVVCYGIEVAYGGVMAVEDVSFDVHAGEVFGLLGPNGAGKTSVIRALSTIINVSGGSATIAGYPLTEPARVRSVIGVLPESNGYPGSVSAYDYLVYFGRLYGQSTSAANARSAELLVDVGLEHVADNLIRTFSRGMRQRLGIARALINRPQVLFLDEPTLGLDPAGREDVLARLSEIASEQGTSVVLCSHLLDDVERICDRIAILHHGKVISAGTVADVIGDSDLASAATITVEPGYRDDAVDILGAQPRVALAATHTGRRGQVDLELSQSDYDTNQLLRALLDAHIPITGLQSHRTRLSDAFLALTGAEGAAGDGN